MLGMILMSPPRKRIQKRTRKVRRVVEITEHRCQWCQRWFEVAKMPNARYCPQNVRSCRAFASLKRRGLA